MKMIYFTDGKSFATAISVDLFQTKSQIHFQLLSINERKTLSDKYQSKRRSHIIYDSSIKEEQ